MLTTKRYDYVSFDSIRIHPDVGNHRQLDQRKVKHYKQDILQNGLLEPLVVWEKRPGDNFLVGGFHRLAAIKGIREDNPGYFDRVDVRVVTGDLDEIRALNLKLNADRLDARVTDYFDVVIFLNNANWPKERIAAFLDRSTSWIADIIRYVPIMDSRVRGLLEEGRISWSKAKSIARNILEAEPGKEREVLERELASLSNGNGNGKPKRRPLTLRKAKERLARHVQTSPNATYKVSAADLMSLLLLLEGKEYQPEHVERVRSIFPTLLEQPHGTQEPLPTVN